MYRDVAPPWEAIQQSVTPPRKSGENAVVTRPPLDSNAPGFATMLTTKFRPPAQHSPLTLPLASCEGSVRGKLLAPHDCA